MAKACTQRFNKRFLSRVNTGKGSVALFASAQAIGLFRCRKHTTTERVLRHRRSNSVNFNNICAYAHSHTLTAQRLNHRGSVFGAEHSRTGYDDIDTGFAHAFNSSGVDATVHFDYGVLTIYIGK